MDHLKVLENVLGSCKELLVELKRWAEVCQTSFFLPLTLQGNLERQALLLRIISAIISFPLFAKNKIIKWHYH